MQKSTPPPPHRITLHDVAEAAGCSKSTVSCALLGTQPLKESTRKKIFETVERLGYRPYCRRADGRLRRKVIAVLLNASTTEIVNPAISEMFFRRGYLAQFCILPRHDAKARCIHETLSAIRRERTMAGILSFHTDLESPDLLRYAGELPVEIFNRKDSMLSTVFVDYAAIGVLAGKVLGELGHPKVAFLVNDAASGYGTAERLASVCEGIRRSAGFLHAKAEFRMISDPLRSSERKTFSIMDQLLEEGFTAYFISGGQEVVKVLRWCHKRRLQIPRDLSLLLWEHGKENESYQLPLSAVSTPYDALIERSIDHLIAKIESHEISKAAFQPIYVDHGSTAVYAETHVRSS